MKSIKANIIPCQYLVMEVHVMKWDILNLSIYQLQMIIPTRHPSVDPKLIVVWAPICSLTDQIQEIYHD